MPQDMAGQYSQRQPGVSIPAAANAPPKLWKRRRIIRSARPHSRRRPRGLGWRDTVLLNEASDGLKRLRVTPVSDSAEFVEGSIEYARYFGYATLPSMSIWTIKRCKGLSSGPASRS